MSNSNTAAEIKVAGIHTYKCDGAVTTKLRFGKDYYSRVKRIYREEPDSIRVEFIELPSTMTKVEALRYMESRPEFSSEEDQQLIAETLKAHLPKVPGKRGRPAKVRLTGEELRRARNRAVRVAIASLVK